MLVEPLLLRMKEAVAQGVAPSAQSCVVYKGQVVFSNACGSGGEGDGPITARSRYDVASVSKILCTTACLYGLLSRGVIALDEPVATYLPAFGRRGKERLTVRQLMAHGSGLPAWATFFASCLDDPVARGIYPELRVRPQLAVEAFGHARKRVVDWATGMAPEQPPGQRVYSDVGFICLGALIEAVSGSRLDAVARETVWGPLGLEATGFRPIGAQTDASGIVCTGTTRPREPAPGQEALYSVHPQAERVIAGEVDDDNAYAMGGIAGHAGVFSTAEDVARFGWTMVEELAGAGRIGDAGCLSELMAPDTVTQGLVRGLGFDHPSGDSPSCGLRFGRAGSRGAVGHLGFTGCSLWVDLDRELSVALLTNRVYPTRKNVEGIRRFRPAFHNAVLDALDLG